MNSELKPKIRFKGFTDDWEQRKLKEIGEILTGSTPSTSQEDYYSSDGTLWVTPTDIYSNIIKNTARKLSIKGEKVARIVPKNTILVTCIASIGKNALVLEKSSFNQQINSLTPFDKYNSYFLLTDSVLWSNKMKQQGAAGMMQIVNKNEFSELETNIPSENEQNRIGELYKQIDNLITLHQRKCDKLVELKKSLLEKMFPQNNSVIPEIRFKGFTDDWEQRKLSSLSRNVGTGKSKYNISQSNKYAILGSRGVIGYDNNYDYSGDFILTARVGEYAGELYRYNGNVKITDNTVYIQGDNLDYLYYLLKQYDLKKLSFGSGQPLVKASELSNLELQATKDNKEKEKISTLFYEIDNLITLHQRKHDKLNKIKQSLLNDMFV